MSAIRRNPRRINMSFMKDMAASAGAAGAAVLYEDWAIGKLVTEIQKDNVMGKGELAAFHVSGLFPLLAAGFFSGKGVSPFWDGLGGAVIFNRLDNLMPAWFPETFQHLTMVPGGMTGYTRSVPAAPSNLYEEQ